MQQAIEVLRSKDVHITAEEAEGVCIAILLHDIGHGPFSHTLEHTLMQVTHEDLSLYLMEELNEAFGGRLELAMSIFKDEYSKHFLHQLVSGQLDMDRMDYLNRDSFFTGVHEGVIGYDRIIKMLSVQDGELVVEEKGIYSIEKFLIARRIMYWQVYLHKTVLSAEQMMIVALKRAKDLVKQGEAVEAPPALSFFLSNAPTEVDFEQDRSALLRRFAALDDYDVMTALKYWQHHPDKILAYLSQCLINRRLFRLEFSNEPFDAKYLEQVQKGVLYWSELDQSALDYLFIQGEEANAAYRKSKDEIKILKKNGQVIPMSESTDYDIQSKAVRKHYICYPKIKF
jgi:HD superfamily phosphohydrolase